MSRLTLEEFCKQNACEEILSHLVSKHDYTLPYASHVKVKWVCSEGHNFDNEVYKYTTPGRLTFKRFSCPVCKGQRVLEGVNGLATVNKDMSLEWDYSLNTLLPTQVTSGSHKSVWWRCKRGHSWRARISARTYASQGCPFCSKIPRTSLGEQYLFLYCKRAFDSLTYNRYKLDGVELDVYIPDASLAIEFDGSYWHSLKDTSYKRDFCSERGVYYNGAGAMGYHEDTNPTHDVSYYKHPTVYSCSKCGTSYTGSGTCTKAKGGRRVVRRRQRQ